MIAQFNDLEKSWDRYPKSKAKRAFRGDTIRISKSYDLLNNFIEKHPITGGQKETQPFDQIIQIKQIFFTSAQASMSYVATKSILWDLHLEDGHRGINDTESGYPSEDEITFPIDTQVQITALHYLPEDTSYLDNKSDFGTKHRYVVEGVIKGAAVS